MRYHYLRDAVAHRVHRREALEAYLHTQPKEHVLAISRNPHLPRDMWDRLFTKAPYEVASNLVARDLDDDQIRRALKDRRKTVERSLLLNGLANASAGVLAEVVERYVGDRECAAFLVRSSASALTPQQRNRLARAAGGWTLGQELTNTSTFTDDEAIVLLDQMTDGGWMARDVLPKRPALLEHYVRSRHHLMRRAAARSPYLFDESLRTHLHGSFDVDDPTAEQQEIWIDLLANPATPTSVADAIVRRASAKGRRCSRRSRVTNAYRIWKSAPGEPITEPLEHLTDPEARRRVEYFDGERDWSSARWPIPWASSTETHASTRRDLERVLIDRTLVGENWWMIDLDDVVDQIDRRIGANASHWEVFWSLLPEWNGTVGELVTSSGQLAA